MKDKDGIKLSDLVQNGQLYGIEFYQILTFEVQLYTLSLKYAKMKW